ncbi:MAG: gliding motility-associated-like protein [Lentimonas sp.]
MKKKKLIKRAIHILLVLLSLVAVPKTASATHIVGGEIYYDYLGSNQYRFFIVLFRDCNTITGADYDNPLSLGVYASNGSLVTEVLIPFPGSNVLTVLPPNACVSAPANICTERAVYIKMLTLEPRVGGYTVAYQRCCRGPDILNLVNPESTGLTIQAKIPGANTGNAINSSPRFINYPPLVICNNTLLEFNHAATDPDGDNLVYSLTTPSQGASSGDPAPQPPPPPPYSPVLWNNGFNQVDQLGNNANISINSSTGELLATPNMLGLYVVGIKVSEFRNGVLVGETVRDFLFKVVNCSYIMEARLPSQEQLESFEDYCDPTIEFDNLTYGASSYDWDFGVPGITTDVSNLQYPTYTYPEGGDYIARVIGNNNNGCIDTAFINIRIDEVLFPDFQFTDSICFANNNFDLLGTHGASNSADYTYTFPPESNMTTTNDQNVFGLSFSQQGTFPVILYVKGADCEAEITKTISTLPVPVTDYLLPENYECNGLTLQFFDNSTNAYSYSWDFGVLTSISDTSDLPNPSFTYDQAGVYSIQLVSGSTGACFDTITQTLEIYKELVVDFTNDDSLCFTDNQFDFFGLIDGPDIANYVWDFGPNTQPSSSTDTNVYAVHFDSPGNHLIKLKGSFLQCKEERQKSIFIYKEPEIGFTIEPDLQCSPATVQFINQSTADTPMSFEWDFSNGQTSTAVNPSQVYVEPGSYPVTLILKTVAGCIDTLELRKDNLIDVKPVPISLFYPSVTTANICESEIIFRDESTGATSIDYNLDDKGGIVINAPTELAYQFQTSGNKTIVQTAYNEFGCTSTSQKSIYIEPFTVFVPNAFTPDNNEYNNSFNAVSYLNAEEWHLRIYNRWGQLVFESFDQNKNWDGTFEGELLKPDVFIYIIELTACGQEDKYRTLKGHVSLIR